MKNKTYGLIAGVSAAVVGAIFMVPAIATNDTIAGDPIGNGAYTLRTSGYASKDIDPNVWVVAGEGAAPDMVEGVYASAGESLSLDGVPTLIKQGDKNYEAAAYLLTHLGHYHAAGETQARDITQAALNTLLGQPTPQGADTAKTQDALNIAKQQAGPYAVDYTESGYYDSTRFNYTFTNVTVTTAAGNTYDPQALATITGGTPLTPTWEVDPGTGNAEGIFIHDDNAEPMSEHQPAEGPLPLGTNTTLGLDGGRECTTDMGQKIHVTGLPSTTITTTTTTGAATLARAGVTSTADSPSKPVCSFGNMSVTVNNVTHNGEESISSDTTTDSVKSVNVNVTLAGLTPGVEYKAVLNAVGSTTSDTFNYMEEPFTATSETETRDFTVPLERYNGSGVFILASVKARIVNGDWATAAISDVNDPNARIRHNVKHSLKTTFETVDGSKEIPVAEGDAKDTWTNITFTSEVTGLGEGVNYIEVHLYGKDDTLIASSMKEEIYNGVPRKTDVSFENPAALVGQTLRAKVVLSDLDGIVAEEWVGEIPVVGRSLGEIIDGAKERNERDNNKIVEENETVKDLVQPQSGQTPGNTDTPQSSKPNTTPDEGTSTPDNNKETKPGSNTPTQPGTHNNKADNTPQSSAPTQAPQQTPVQKALASTGTIAGSLALGTAALIAAGVTFTIIRKRSRA